jgi:hypothetical protein
MAMHLLSTFLVVGGRVIVMKKNNDSFKYRNRLHDEKDFPKIKTIPKKLHKSWGGWKVCHAVTLRGKFTHEKSIQRKTNDNQSTPWNIGQEI